MNKEEHLNRKIKELIKESKENKLKWRLVVQTTEYNDSDTKPVVEQDGKEWLVDECYVCYECKYKNEDFLMITYEMIHTSGEEIQTTNLIFLPPLGIRYFDISVLMPYSVEASNILVYDVHTLWELLLRLKKSGSENIELVADARALTIEE